MPSLTALAASQLHSCISSHFAGKGFQKLKRLALHTIEPDACTCLAAQVLHAAPPAVPHSVQGGHAAAHGAVVHAAANGGPMQHAGGAAVMAAPSAAPIQQHAPPMQPHLPMPGAITALHHHHHPHQHLDQPIAQLHAQVQQMLHQHQPMVLLQPPPQQHHHQQHHLLLPWPQQLLLQVPQPALLHQGPPLAQPAPPPLQQQQAADPAAAPVVERVGLLVALCPALQQLSVGCGSAAVLRAVERHEMLQQLVIHGQAHPSHGASVAAAHAASALFGGIPIAALAPSAVAQPLPPLRHGGAAGAAVAAQWRAPRMLAHSAVPPVAAIEGHAWGLLRRRLPRLSRLSLMNADVLLGGSPSPAVPLLALADAGSVAELQLMHYSAATDEGLAIGVPLMGGVRSLALGGCKVRDPLGTGGRMALAAWHGADVSKHLHYALNMALDHLHAFRS